MPSLESLQLAEARVGAVWVGIPADSVLQALALPAAPSLLPRRHGALLGVVDYEGRLVPVVDLARWVDVGVAPADQDGAVAAGARVLILHAAGRTIGLKVDTVGGLVDVEAQAVTRLHHDACEDEVFHCVVREPAGGRILSLLDAGRLARLAAAWHAEESPAAAGQDAAPGTSAAPAPALRSYAVLQAGTERLALATEALTEVLPLPALDILGAGSGLAWCAWRGRHLPVLASAALGLAPAADGARPTLLAVVEHDGLALGLPVHAALGLQEFAATESTAQPAASDALLAPLFEPDGGHLRLLDTACLFARCSEAQLSRSADGGAHLEARGGAADPAANATAYIVFEGEGMAAVAIDAVERIVSLRDAATDGKGAMAWEGRAIPLRDLRASAQDGAAGDVMVVRGRGTQVAYVVARVHLLVPPGAGRIYRMGGPAAGWSFITTGDDAGQASYRIVDLEAQAA